jgi:hypothetical protein
MLSLLAWPISLVVLLFVLVVPVPVVLPAARDATATDSASLYRRAALLLYFYEAFEMNWHTTATRSNKYKGGH